MIIVDILIMLIMLMLSADGISKMFCFYSSDYYFICLFIMILVMLFIILLKKLMARKIQKIYKLTFIVLYSIAICFIYIGFYNFVYQFIYPVAVIDKIITTTTAIALTVITLFCQECITTDVLFRRISKKR